MLLISDDMRLLDAEAGKLFRAFTQIAEEIDANATREPVLALDLMSAGNVRGLIAENADGSSAIAMLLNRGDAPTRIQTSDLSYAAEIYRPRSRRQRENRNIRHDRSAAHSARILRIRR